MALCLTTTVITTVTTFNQGFMLGAKLFHTRTKFAPRRTEELGLSGADRMLSPLLDQQAVDWWFASYTREEIQGHLDKYFDMRAVVASPDDFKHYLLEQAPGGAQSLTYISLRLAEQLFEDRIEALVRAAPLDSLEA